MAVISLFLCLGPHVNELLADSAALQGFVSIRAPVANKRDGIYSNDCLIGAALLAGTWRGVERTNLREGFPQTLGLRWFLDLFRNPQTDPLGALLVFAFYHYSQERLGPRRTDKYSSFISQISLLLFDQIL